MSNTVLRFLGLMRLFLASVLGGGLLLWLLLAGDPQDPRARLLFVLALAAVVYGLVGLSAAALARAYPVAAGGLASASFGERQGALWAGLVAAFVLLRFSGELSAVTTFAALAAFAGAQWAWLGHGT
ncbi:MAG: hypothetical protein ACYC4L_21365 [Chloroflexota bacterium]